VVAGVLAAMAIAALVGWLAFYYGASPLYGSIITLALPIVLTQIVFSGGRFTGSSSGLSGFPTYYWSFEVWFWIAGAYLVIVTALAWLFVSSDSGRLLVALRENENRCWYLGVPAARIRIALMVVTAGVGAAAGCAYAAFTNVVAPELTGFLLGTELLIWVALGGRGTLFGPVIGAILISVVSAYLSGTLPFVWTLFLGITFVVVIVLLPQGLAPPVFALVARGWARLRPPTPPQPVAVARAAPAPAAKAPEGTPALVVTGLQRRYGSLKVLEGIGFSVRHGELLSVIGPNGAGKTTLMRCLSDGSERTAGTVVVNGHDIGRLSPDRICGFGLGRSFQNTNLFDTLSVAECLRLARYRHDGPSLWRQDATLRLPDAALQVMRATGLDRELATSANVLSHGMKRALELVMVLAMEPSVLLLDEPTAGLTKAERTLIGGVLTELVRDHGLGVVLIEHDLDFVREISSRVIVLHQGGLILDGTVEEVVSSEAVRAVYSGHAPVGGAH
jgi:branched-chain amino acid transport system permease protein